MFDVNGGASLAASGGNREPGEAIDIGIRTDRVRLSEPAEKTLGFNGVVSNVEYRGASAKITVMGAGSEDFTVIATDADYFEKPVAVGDAVSLSWGLEDAVLLGAAAA